MMKNFLVFCLAFVAISMMASLLAVPAEAANGRGFLGIRGRIEDRQEQRAENRADNKAGAQQEGRAWRPFQGRRGRLFGGC